MSHIAAIVPAAGLSTRMGQFKPVLPLGDGTVLGATLRAFAGAGVQEVLVVTGNRATTVAEEVAAAVAGAVGTATTGWPSVRVVHNPEFEAGMFSSILVGVRALDPRTEAFFVLPADMPLVRSRTVVRLLAARRESAARLVYPVFLAERGHPPLLDRAIVPEILAHDGQGGLRAVLERWEGDALDVAVADSGTVRDLDRPADYEDAVCRVGRSFPDERECEALWTIHAPAESVSAKSGPAESVPAKPAPANPVRAHCRAVALVAQAMCERINAARSPENLLNPTLVHNGALVHDLAKGHPGHEVVGATWLREHGFFDAAHVVARHSDLELAPGASLGECEVVFLADKVVRGTEPVPLELRYAEKQQRFGKDAAVRNAIEGRKRRALAVLHAFAAETGADLEALSCRVLSPGLAHDGVADRPTPLPGKSDPGIPGRGRGA